MSQDHCKGEDLSFWERVRKKERRKISLGTFFFFFFFFFFFEGDGGKRGKEMKE